MVTDSPVLSQPLLSLPVVTTAPVGAATTLALTLTLS